MSTPDRLTAANGLSLRRWRPQDAPAVRRAFSGALMDRQTAEPVVDLTAAHRWLDQRDAEWAADRCYSWAVTDGTTLLGCVQVGAVNRLHETGWVSYWTTEAARGRGVASAATRTLADWAFGELRLYRLELGHRVDNPASCRVATRAGFAIEGLQRAKLAYADGRHDVELHARLADD